MHDYYPIMAGAVSKLDTNTLETRRTLFERARAILHEQLRLRDPPATEPEIVHERFALEDAIRKVESRVGRRPRFARKFGGRGVNEAFSGTPQVSIIEQRPVDSGPPRGRITISEGRSTIEFFKSADASTFAHLCAVDWLQQLLRDAEHPLAPSRSSRMPLPSSNGSASIPPPTSRPATKRNSPAGSRPT